MAESYWYSSLTAEEIEATLLGSVRGDVVQDRSTSWKAQARANIGAGSENTGFQILGYYLTLQEMKDSLQVLPQPGDAYGIAVFRLTTDVAPEAGIKYYTRSGSGTTEDPYVYTLFDGASFEPGVDYYVISHYDTYVYDGASQSWLDIGPINEGEFIDDSEVSPILTWSSQKIKNELDAIDLSALIDDSDTAADTTWSSDKISSELSGKAAPASSFTVTLLSASWSNNAQTVSDSRFVANGYAYIVTPASASFSDYAGAVIYADDVTTNGTMVFHCGTVPDSDLTVNIVRVVSA